MVDVWEGVLYSVVRLKKIYRRYSSVYSGGSKKGARAPHPPYFGWKKKKWLKEEKPAGQLK